MRTRTLNRSPAILPLYARAAAPLIPGASLLPFLPGRGKDMPELELTLPGVRPDLEAVAAYAKVCGFALRDRLPPTYPHVLAFPLHMAAMADGRFPFGAVGLVHVENRIVQRQPIGIGEELEVRVRTTPLRPHSHGRSFGLATEIWIEDRKAWESISTMLRRGPVTKQPADGPIGPVGPDLSARRPKDVELTPSAEWRLGGDLGRRYAAVSGDRNPIHLHALTAKPLGFPSAIAHGMWTKARCLAALENRHPEAFATEVRFRKPIRLPSRVEFLGDAGDEAIRFAVRDAKSRIPHLDGWIEPLEPQPNPRRRSQ